MLSRDPEVRPTAKGVLLKLAKMDMQASNGPDLIFRSCCMAHHSQTPHLSLSQFRAAMTLKATSSARLPDEVYDASFTGSHSRPATSIFDRVREYNNTYPSTPGTSLGLTDSKTIGYTDIPDNDTDDVGTNYSIDSRANDYVLEHVQAFAHRLARETELDTTLTSSPSIPLSGLRDVLKDFARRLHEESMDPFVWEASVAIHRNRE
jgi:hypothetical protein